MCGYHTFVCRDERFDLWSKTRHVFYDFPQSSSQSDFHEKGHYCIPPDVWFIVSFPSNAVQFKKHYKNKLGHKKFSCVCIIGREDIKLCNKMVIEIVNERCFDLQVRCLIVWGQYQNSHRSMNSCLWSNSGWHRLTVSLVPVCSCRDETSTSLRMICSNTHLILPAKSWGHRSHKSRQLLLVTSLFWTSVH